MGTAHRNGGPAHPPAGDVRGRAAASLTAASVALDYLEELTTEPLPAGVWARLASELGEVQARLEALVGLVEGQPPPPPQEPPRQPGRARRRWPLPGGSRPPRAARP